MIASFKERLALVRSALYLPASNARAIAKAQRLDCDLAILDLEDSVPDIAKDAAREAAAAALGERWQCDFLAVRVNGNGTAFQDQDVAMVARAKPHLVVAPKIESTSEAAAIAAAVGVPLLAMIETPAGVYAAREIAAAEGVVGVLVGTNDLAACLRLPPEAGRVGMMMALQQIVLAARAAGCVVFDGVYNTLDDPAGFVEQCREGRALGFDGKTLVHPNQIEPCNRLFGPSEAEIEDALALIEASTGGAERFRGRMIEAMHVMTARQILARARQ